MISALRNNVLEPQHVLITGGAGYIGSLLTGVLLSQGHRVTVVDDLLFGGESLLGYWHHPNFRFIKGDVCDPDLLKVENGKLKIGRPVSSICTLQSATFDAVVHLAAIVGFPACQAVGKQVAWRYNVEGTQHVFEADDAAGVKRFILSSTYSNYGVSENGQPVTEESPLYPPIPVRGDQDRRGGIFAAASGAEQMCSFGVPVCHPLRDFPPHSV